MTRSAHWVELRGKVMSEPRPVDSDYIFRFDANGQIYEVILKVRRRDVKVDKEVVVAGFLIDRNLLAYKCKPVRKPIREVL